MESPEPETPEPGHFAQVNYFDLVETNTELAKQLLGVLAAPLRLPREARAWPQEYLYQIQTRDPVWPLVVRIGSTHSGVYIRLTAADGTPLRQVVWPYSDEVPDFNKGELP